MLLIDGYLIEEVEEEVITADHEENDDVGDFLHNEELDNHLTLKEASLLSQFVVNDSNNNIHLESKYVPDSSRRLSPPIDDLN